MYSRRCSSTMCVQIVSLSCCNVGRSFGLSRRQRSARSHSSLECPPRVIWGCPFGAFGVIFSSTALFTCVSKHQTTPPMPQTLVLEFIGGRLLPEANIISGARNPGVPTAAAGTLRKNFPGNPSGLLGSPCHVTSEFPKSESCGVGYR